MFNFFADSYSVFRTIFWDCKIFDESAKILRWYELSNDLHLHRFSRNRVCNRVITHNPSFNRFDLNIERKMLPLLRKLYLAGNDDENTVFCIHWIEEKKLFVYIVNRYPERKLGVLLQGYRSATVCGKIECPVHVWELRRLGDCVVVWKIDSRLSSDKILWQFLWISWWSWSLNVTFEKFNTIPQRILLYLERTTRAGNRNGEPLSRG